MSGIAGIYNLDGRPADPLLLRRMTGAMAHRGPDGAGHWVRGPVALGHRMLHTTPESLLETQPLTDESGILCLTLDGRVDNREELRAALEAKGARLRDSTDAELVLRAYEIWGEECPAKILGDFAFALWDGRKRQLYCARDIWGFRPFHYYAGERKFLFSSELRAILEEPTLARRPNEGMIGEFLAGAVTDKEETLFQDIYRLPPAHYLIIQPGQVRKFRYWDIDPSREIRYQTDQEYTEHFLAIFKEAVRCRLRSHRPVGAHLSGGMDSSSVVATAQLLFREGTVADPGLETFSLIYPGMPCDESHFSRQVSEFCGCRANSLPPAEIENASYFTEQTRRSLDFPDYPNGGLMRYSVNSLAQERGFRVLLTGHGGNYWLESHPVHLADLLRRFRVFRFIRQARSDTTFMGYSSPLPLMLRYGLRPLLPQPVLRAAKWILRKKPAMRPWIPEPFARRIGLAERLRKEDRVGSQFSSFAKRTMYRGGTCGTQLQVQEVVERATAAGGVEERHPLQDRRLIEFAMAVPEQQLWRDEQPKYILREAMGPYLPATVRNRLVQADFSSLFLKPFRQLAGGAPLRSLAIATQGWVDAEKSLALYDKAVIPRNDGGRGFAGSMWPLWMIFATELWFQTAFLRGDELSLQTTGWEESQVPVM